MSFHLRTIDSQVYMCITFVIIDSINGLSPVHLLNQCRPTNDCNIGNALQ